MTKTELIKHVADTCRLPTKQVAAVIDTAINAVKDELTVGNEVNLLGFGKFSVRNRAARNGRNPRTGEVIQLSETKRVHFTTSKTLKGAVK